ncbi:hypothetical protein N1F89_06085 [Aquibium sp. A9E412]|nr:hypothetical protein [Aquibium sp. A9E412]MDN2565785.1 hypothetical protein [Aquibium sp. A9E412]
MAKKNRKGNREARKPKQAKAAPQQTTSSVAELAAKGAGRNPARR